MDISLSGERGKMPVVGISTFEQLKDWCINDLDHNMKDELTIVIERDRIIIKNKYTTDCPVCVDSTGNIEVYGTYRCRITGNATPEAMRRFILLVTTGNM